MTEKEIEIEEITGKQLKKIEIMIKSMMKKIEKVKVSNKMVKNKRMNYELILVLSIISIIIFI